MYFLVLKKIAVVVVLDAILGGLWRSRQIQAVLEALRANLGGFEGLNAILNGFQTQHIMAWQTSESRSYKLSF